MGIPFRAYDAVCTHIRFPFVVVGREARPGFPFPSRGSVLPGVPSRAQAIKTQTCIEQEEPNEKEEDRAHETSNPEV